MKPLPDHLRTILQQYGVEERDVFAWMECDRDPDGTFRNRWLVLDAQYLYVLTDPRPVADKTFQGYVFPRSPKKEATVPPADVQVERTPVENIDSVFVVHLVASGLIAAKCPEEKVLAAFTNAQMREAAQFVRTFEKWKKGERPESRQDDERESIRACPTCGMPYPEKDRAVCPKCMKKHALFVRLLSFAWKYKRSLIWIIVFMLLNAGTGLVIPYLMGTVFFDQALGGTGRFAGQIGLVIALILLFRVLSLLFGIAYSNLNARMAANIAFELKANVFSAMQRLSLSFFQQRHTGQLMTRVNNDATDLQYFFVDGIPYFIVNAINIIGIITILAVLDWKLTLLCLAPLPLVLWVVRRVFPKLWRLSWRRHRRMSRLNAMINDTVRGARVVKAFGKESQEIGRFQRANESFSQVEQSFNKLGATVFPALNALTQAGGLIIWALGGYRVMHGHLSFGDLMSFIQYILMLYGPLQFMNNIVNWWSYCMSAAQRIFEIQDAVPTVVEKPGALHLEKMRGDIEVSDITFGYEPNKPALKHVSMRAEPGQMIGIVGHSGAGKSTLVNLISRLYDVDEGEIRIDGIPIKDIAMSSLRKHIGIVSQEVYIFMGTIAENIAYANPDCSMEDIIRAAKIAKAHDFIEKLPDGYDTMVGSGGYALSGGEKQRISIARAILHDPAILILDEATASLDTETELQIQEALETLVRGRTTIAIAHRLSTLRNADRLIVMDRGQVVEAGTHEELMMTGGMYAKLVKQHYEALKMKGVG